MKTIPLKIHYLTKSSMALATIVLFTGCKVGPDYLKPEVTIPKEFRKQTDVSNSSYASDTASVADLPWWNVFEDEELHYLIREALRNNNNLQIATSRIEQARALVGVAKSQAIPQIEYKGFGGYEKTFVPSETERTIEYTTTGGVLTAAWELDVWGRIRRSTESAQAQLLAQEDVRRGVILTLVSDVAANYFQLLELDRELAIAKESSGTYKKMLDLFSDRARAGKDSDLPVHRAQAAYSSSIAAASSLQRQIVQQENAISVLVGDYPRNIIRGYPLVKQALPETPLGTTTDILRRRPDIMQSENVMKSANAEIGVAVANVYPKIGLSALVGGQTADVNNEFSSFSIANALANITGPIFTGGRLKSIYMNRQAFWDETVAQYKQTVLNAFKETSDALTAQKNLLNQRNNLQQQVKALRNSADLALLRYDGGRASYFEVLEAQQQLFPAETALAQTQRDQLTAVVNIYKSLGGGWKSAEAAENYKESNINKDSMKTGGE